MPTKCSVSDCDNYYAKGVPFFDVPSPLKYKFCSEKADLSKKRRKLWLNAIGVSDTTSGILRICSKHFVTGKPAALEDSTNVDWIPTLHTKLNSSVHRKHSKGSESNSRRNEDLSRSSRSSKDVVSKHAKSHKGSGYKSENRIKKGIRKNAKKVDVKKFLNCKVLLDGNIQCTTFKGTNGSGLTIAQKHGYFTSDNIRLKETAINNTVLRIHLLREDLDDLKRKYKPNSLTRRKRREQKVSSFGRQIKRKSQFVDNAYSPTPSKRSVENKTVDKQKPYNLTIDTPRQMKNRNEKENRSTSIIQKFQSRHELARSMSEKTILQNAIKKSFRDRIKIKLFPRGMDAPIARSIKNGSLDLAKGKTPDLHREILFVKNDQQWTYYLKFNPPRYPEEGTLNYSFQKLVTDVKHMKLPAPSWKIKVIIRQGKISAITFTNKLSLERSVAFSANSDTYKITIDNKPALLLGSPGQIHTSEDLEILLDIIQNIDSNNPMIFYK